MPTNNLGAPRIASGAAANQHTTSNDGDNWLDAAITEPMTILAESTTITVTATEFSTHVTFIVVDGSPAAGGAITFNVPNTNALAATLKRGMFTVVNDTSQNVTVQVSGQSETPPTLSSGQRSILVMDGTDVYLAVPQGIVGGDGTDPGILFTWDTGTADADPGPGKIRANNASLASATSLYIDDVDRSGNNAESHLLTWDDSTNTIKGHLYLTRGSDGAQAIFTVGTVTDSTGYIGLAITYVSGATSFTAADVISAQFYRAGNAGTATGDFELIVAVGDETTAITTGTAKVTFRMPVAVTLTDVRGSLTTASSSGVVTVDINEGGTTILSTKLTIDANEKTSTTAAAPSVISDSSLADDAEMTIDIDGAGTGAAGLKVTLIGTRT